LNPDAVQIPKIDRIGVRTSRNLGQHRCMNLSERMCERRSVKRSNQAKMIKSEVLTAGEMLAIYNAIAIRLWFSAASCQQRQANPILACAKPDTFGVLTSGKGTAEEFFVERRRFLRIGYCQEKMVDLG
jgi:hypothetical protein